MATTKRVIESVEQLLNYADPGSRKRTGDSPYKGHGPIKYDSTKNEQITTYGDEKWLTVLVQALNKCEIPCVVPESKYFDFQMEQAIRNFQTKYMDYIPNPGVLDDVTVQQIFFRSNHMSDVIEQEDTQQSTTVTNGEESLSPHYNSFFSENNTKQFRQNHKNIRIVFGESGLIKTLYDVVMRSVGVEVDTSGNPVSETYEFIARDVTETDEANDFDNYVNENGTSPSDIKYKFNFH